MRVTAKLLNLSLVVALLLGLPLIGVWVSGQPIARYLEFPPTTRYVAQAPFSWGVFAALTIAIFSVILPFDIHVWLSRRRRRSLPTHGMRRRPAALQGNGTKPEGPQPRRTFPWWGRTGIALSATTWILAWTRIPWFAPFQLFTFSPLWLGYILVINALTWQRTGHCMLLDRPRHTLGLFAWSAAFWWFFEYLNRFVQNWFYEGIGGLTPLQYFIFATLPFSTVLPAVLGTSEWLASFPAAGCGLDSFIRVRVPRPRLLAASTLALSALGLAAIGIRPDLLFPLLWVSPLLIIVSLQGLRGRPTLLSPLCRGQWRRLYLLAAAALVCGLFWELWNFGSCAKWIYTVPYVNRFRLFEMPVLGYAGYLPFGLECAVIADWLCGPGAAAQEKRATGCSTDPGRQTCGSS
jgi:hypothetical protein